MDRYTSHYDLKSFLEADKSDEMSNFKYVWIAVIEQAFIDAKCLSKKPRELENKKLAIKWLTGKSKAFEDVCLKAGLDPNKVRSQALKSFYLTCHCV